jgi:two-component system, oxyanion-binding sensor
MRRWGQVGADVDAAKAAAAVYLPALHREAAARVGVACPETDSKSEGEHAGIWALPLTGGPLPMGADCFFDGALFGANGQLSVTTR